VERQNLLMRMSISWFRRLTNAFAVRINTAVRSFLQLVQIRRSPD
jgi:hypothetical protein